MFQTTFEICPAFATRFWGCD